MRLSYEFDNILGAVYHRGSIKFGPDGSSLFSPVGNKIVVYDLKEARSRALPLQVNYNIHRLSIHPQGSILLAASEKSHLYIISLIAGRLLHLKEYKSFSEITHLSFSPDGRYYAVCGENLVLIYVTPGTMIKGRGREITPFRLLKKVRINHDIIDDLNWSQNSEYLCIASRDNSLNIISLNIEDRSISRLRGHSDNIIACYFSDGDGDDLQLFSITKSCQLFTWQRVPDENGLHVSEMDVDQEGSTGRQETKKFKADKCFRRSGKHFLRLAIEADESKEERQRRASAYVTATDYNSKTNLLVLGYNTGHYSLYELPSATLIYDLDSTSGAISSISINKAGDWIALASSVDPEVDIVTANNKTQSRIFVWEWQSKSHVLDQTGSGSSMRSMHESVSYSLDGTHVVSGNIAGRIKVWSGLTGETIASFGQEHLGPIKAIKFVPNKSGKVIVSASLDGTIRAYDLNKFKNFRTFQSPVPERSPEFICLDVDSTGEFIAAGTYNYFEIYLYSIQTGKFLEYLTGHEGPVSGVSFSPVSNLLASSSWDRTIRIWNLFEGSKCLRDTITFNHEIITVTFRPDGNQFAASLSNGHIAIFNPHTAEQIGAPIEGASDLGTTQLISDTSRDDEKFFTALNYSADGTYLIGGGNSNFICIYHVNEKILVKKISMTINMSMDGIFDYISNRKVREFGYNLELLQKRHEERTHQPIKLPGVRKGDLGDREAKAVVSVHQVAFSPTMRSFVAATTEGVLIYSLDISRQFDPYRLTLDVSPSSVMKALQRQDYGQALIQSLQLNETILTQEVIEAIPLSDLETILVSLDIDYVKRLLRTIATIFPHTRHIEFYLKLVRIILYKHGMTMKNLPSKDVTPIIRAIHQGAQRVFMDIKRNSDFCTYSLSYLTKAGTRTSSRGNQDENTSVDGDHKEDIRNE